MFEPTDTQIKYAVKLINELGYDLDDYDFSEMNRLQVSALIRELKEELYK